MDKTTSKICCVSIIVYLAILLFTQGGYFHVPVFLASALLCFMFVVLAILGKIKAKISVSIVMLTALGFVYFLSCIFHPISCTSIVASCVPLAILSSGIILSLVLQSDNKRDITEFIIKGIAILGAVSAAISIIFFFAFYDNQAFVSNGRLCFPFQYSNTSGIWFLVASILCFKQFDKYLRLLFLLPTVALFLTGSISVLILCFIVIVIYTASYFFNHKDSKNIKSYAIVFVFLLLLIIIGVVCVFNGRVGESLDTFIERIIQISDGLAVISNNLIFGIGPDSWQYMYPYIQSAQYTASKIHCSFMQIFLDAGIFAFLIFLGYCVYSFWRIIEHRNWTILPCCAVIFLHMLIDFDISFPFILCLIIILFEIGGSKTGYIKAHNFKSANVVWSFISVLVIMICFVSNICGLYFQSQQNKCINLISNKQDSSHMVIDDLPKYILNDYKASTYIVVYLINSGQDQEALKIEDEQYVTSNQVIFKTKALIRLDNEKTAFDYLFDNLQNQPYNVDFYQNVKELMSEENLSDDWKEQYNNLANKSNSMILKEPARLLSSQKCIELIEL